MLARWILLSSMIAGCARHEPASAPVPTPTTDDACLAELRNRGVAFELHLDAATEHPADDSSLACVVDTPVAIGPEIGGVTFVGLAGWAHFVTSCKMALAIDELASTAKKLNVTEIRHLGSKSCRTVPGSDLLSEHAHARALDITGLRVGGDPPLYVVSYWKTALDQGRTLRTFVDTVRLTATFPTILTPDDSLSHGDHLHLELSR